MQHCTSCDIVHDAGWNDCPLCEANGKISDLENEVDDLTNEVSELQSQVNSMEV